MGRELGIGYCRSEDNDKLNLNKVGCEGVYWIYVTQGIMSTVMMLHIP